MDTFEMTKGLLEITTEVEIINGKLQIEFV